MEEHRIVETGPIAGDSWQYSLRPHYLKEYIGQQKVKQNLEVFIQAAKLRQEALAHVLLYGPPGLGKTTMAGVNLRITSGPAIERPGDLAALLTNLQERDLLFIDEIHRLSHSVEEVLYAAMEDYALDIVIGKGPSARSVRIDLPPFTLVGATTQVGRLAPPLRDRFGVICRLEFYRPEELVLIIKRTADILNVEIDDAGALEVARRSRGTPRIANRLLKRVRDFAQVAGEQTISSALAGKALDRLEVDACGLDRTDRRVLQVIIEKFGGGPVGLDTIAAAISESVDAVEDVYEPFLMQLGFLNRTPRGRVVTEAAYAHLGLPSPSEGKGSSLFYGENLNFNRRVVYCGRLCLAGAGAHRRKPLFRQPARRFEFYEGKRILSFPHRNLPHHQCRADPHFEYIFPSLTGGKIYD